MCIRDSPASVTGCLACGTGPAAINLDGVSLGGNPALPFNLRESRYQVADDFSFTLASHTVRIGVDAWRREDTMDQLWAPLGSYNYDSLSAFATDFSANVRAVKNYATFNQTFGTSAVDTIDWFISPWAEDTLSLIHISSGDEAVAEEVGLVPGILRVIIVRRGVQAVGPRFGYRVDPAAISVGESRCRRRRDHLHLAHRFLHDKRRYVRRVAGIIIGDAEAVQLKHVARRFAAINQHSLRALDVYKRQV